MTSLVRYFSAIALLVELTPAAFARPKPIPVKVVVVAMFEVGNDTGDQPGELQFWVERDHLDRVFPLAAAYHPVRMNGDGEMAVLTGQGTAHAAATIMALGLDPRFDLTHAYWLIAGIAGGSPDRVSLGSAAWARYVVDGDLGYEIDPRETPSDWTTGYVPLRKMRPFEPPATPLDGQVYALNVPLAEWAFNLTRSIPLADTDRLREIRTHFDGASAQRPPFVTLGDEISSSTYWHGKLFDEWAAEWVPYFTGGKGVFATTAMEDTGTAAIAPQSRGRRPGRLSARPGPAHGKQLRPPAGRHVRRRLACQPAHRQVLGLSALARSRLHHRPRRGRRDTIAVANIQAG